MLEAVKNPRRFRSRTTSLSVAGGRGSYGEVWLARNAVGTPRAVMIVRRAKFDEDRPDEPEFAGLRKFEPISRSHEGFVDLVQVGRHDAEGYFYYVMELADSANAGRLSVEALRDGEVKMPSPWNGGTANRDSYQPRSGSALDQAGARSLSE